VAASQNIGAKSTPDAIKSLAKNDGDPNAEVAIRKTTLNDTSVSTTRDVDAAGPTIGSIGGVGTMEGVLTTLNNKNDWGSPLWIQLHSCPTWLRGSNDASCHYNERLNLCYINHIREIISPIRCGSFAS